MYGFLLLIDPESDFTSDEGKAFESALRDSAVFAVVAAEWYSPPTIAEIAFADQNTRSLWYAVGGGSNIPALNRILEPFGVAFGDKIYDGEQHFCSRMFVKANPFINSFYRFLPSLSFMLSLPARTRSAAVRQNLFVVNDSLELTLEQDTSQCLLYGILTIVEHH